MWSNVSLPWREAFLQGWEAFVHGSIPIGAVITDMDGRILVRGRNRIFEPDLPNPKIAHAEAECLRRLDTRELPDVRHYILYTCMEPCPMCMGMAVMSNFRKLRIAARDGYAGAAHMIDTEPYIRSKQMEVIFELGPLQTVQLTLQTYFELNASGGRANRVVEAFRKDCPEAVAIGEDFYASRYLHLCRENGVSFDEIFDQIVKNT